MPLTPCPACGNECRRGCPPAAGAAPRSPTDRRPRRSGCRRPTGASSASLPRPASSCSERSCSCSACVLLLTGSTAWAALRPRRRAARPRGVPVPGAPARRSRSRACRPLDRRYARARRRDHRVAGARASARRHLARIDAEIDQLGSARTTGSGTSARPPTRATRRRWSASATRSRRPTGARVEACRARAAAGRDRGEGRRGALAGAAHRAAGAAGGSADGGHGARRRHFRQRHSGRQRRRVRPARELGRGFRGAREPPQRLPRDRDRNPCRGQRRHGAARTPT